MRRKYLVSDFAATLSANGRLLPGVKELLNNVARTVKLQVVTAARINIAVIEEKG
ncbi:MAG: hypothetical protein ABSG48_04170 [Geobacteraceae bacterium]